MVSGSERLSSRFHTSFIGRVREREALGRSVRTSSFTAIIGPGGVGKTRLVVTVADDASSSFPDGVFFVGLDDVAAADVLCAAISSAVGMRDSDSTTWSDLSRFLHVRRILLVLDGCELLDGDCLLALQDLLDSTDGLAIAATTRRFLHVDGALSVTLPPLPIPPADEEMADEPATREDVASFDAVELFVARARLVRPDFAVTPDNASTIAELCRWLDGLPLALELAAPWVRALSVDQILDRVKQIPDFLRAGTSTSTPRHQTLSSLVEGTYELCSEVERILWSRLAVFAGSFDLDAVDAVCSGPPLDTLGVVDTVTSLLDQSVLVVSNGAGPSRYRMLRVARDYVQRHAGEEAEALVESHRVHFAAAVEKAVERWSSSSQLRVLDELQLDYPNLVAAMDSGLEHAGTAADSARMAADLWPLWFIEGRLGEGRAVLGRVVGSQHLEPENPFRVRSLYVNSYLGVLQGTIRSAQKVYEVAVSNDAGQDAVNRGLRLHVGAMLDMERHDVTGSADLLSDAVDIYGSSGDLRGRALALDAIGIAVMIFALDGQSARADELGRRGIAECDDLGDVVWRGYIDWSLGFDRWMRGDSMRASRAAVAVLSSTPDRLLATHCIELLAWCAARENRLGLAARLLGAADQRWEYLGGYYSGFQALSVHRERCETEARAGLGAATYDSEHTAGRRLRVAAIIALVSTETDQAGAAAGQDEPPLTARELEVARLLADGMSNREIAARLIISPRTVESHVDHILTKLNLGNRTQVATWMVARAAGHEGAAG